MIQKLKEDQEWEEISKHFISDPNARIDLKEFEEKYKTKVNAW
jgi:hypothetical protein